MSKIIKVQNLTCSYGKKDVLKDITFEVAQGDIVFVMGNNGVGKTTLLNCFLRNVLPIGGDISYNDKSICDISNENLSKVFSYVPQNVNLNCDFKVKDYLLLGRNPYISLGNPKNNDYKIVEDLAREMGVLGIVERTFNTLSGGQKQWVAVTRALVQETPVIIMDEPMSALDLGKQAEFLMLIDRLSQNGKTIILTSHNPNHCFYLPKAKVCLLNDKNILAYGTAKQVFSKETVAAIYGENVCLDENQMIKIKI